MEPLLHSAYRVFTNCIAEKQQLSSFNGNLTTPDCQLIKGGEKLQTHPQHLCSQIIRPQLPEIHLVPLTGSLLI